MLAGIVTLIVSVIVAFNPEIAWILLVFPGLYIVYALYITYSKALELKDTIHLTSDEKVVWKKYHAYLRFPFAAPGMSKGLSVIAFTLIILGIVLFIRNTPYQCVALLIVAWYLLFSGMISRLNPQNGIVANAQKGNLVAMGEVEALRSLHEKLNTKK